MNNIDQLYVLVVGANGSGKTTLLETLPGPRLWVDSEGSVRFMATDSMLFEEWQEAGCPDLDENTNVIWPADSWGDFTDACRWLHNTPHPFKTANFDSLSEIQALLAEEIDMEVAGRKNAQLDYYRLLQARLRKPLRALKMLRDPRHPHPVNVGVTCTANPRKVIDMESGTSSSQIEMLLEGGIVRWLYVWFDLIGYLTAEEVFDKAAKEFQLTQKLSFQAPANSDLVLKHRFGSRGLPRDAVLTSPNLSELMDQLNQAV